MKHLKLILVITLFLNSCENTSRLWRDYRNYKETVQQFLIGKDTAKIAFIGTKYHYIFDDSEFLRNALTWENKSKLKMDGYRFFAASPSKINGYITLRTMTSKELSKNKIGNLSENDLEFLKSNGFSSKKIGNEYVWEKKFNLNGERYLPKRGIDYSRKTSLLKQKYDLTISESYNSTSDKAEKILLTPITMISDVPTIITGTIFISLILVVMVPGILIHCAVHGNLSSCHE